MQIKKNIIQQYTVQQDMAWRYTVLNTLLHYAQTEHIYLYADISVHCDIYLAGKYTQHRKDVCVVCVCEVCVRRSLWKQVACVDCVCVCGVCVCVVCVFVCVCVCVWCVCVCVCVCVSEEVYENKWPV